MDCYAAQIPNYERMRLWREDYFNIVQYPIDCFDDEFELLMHKGLNSHVQHFDIKSYLPYDILTKVDIASMMHSLEVRTPLVDHKVFEFASKIPQNLCIRQENGEWIGKSILKKLLRSTSPKTSYIVLKWDSVFLLRNGFP